MNFELPRSDITEPLEILKDIFVIQQIFDGCLVRGVLVVGEHSALLFDSLVFPERTRAILPVCAGRKLIVAYSHADWDHVWGTGQLSPEAVVAHETCAKRFADPDDVQKYFSQYKARHPSELAQVTIVPPTVLLEATTSFDLGGLSVELRLCPGHTADGIVAIVPERGLLIAGDSIETPLPLLNEGADDLMRWIEVLTAICEDPTIEKCIPSHGKIGGRELVSDNLAYLKSLLEAEADPPAELDEFYRHGHEANRRKAATMR